MLTLAAAFLLLPAPMAAVLGVVSVFHAAASAWLLRRPFDGAMCGIVDGGYGVIVAVGTLALIWHP